MPKIHQAVAVPRGRFILSPHSQRTYLSIVVPPVLFLLVSILNSPHHFSVVTASSSLTLWTWRTANSKHTAEHDKKSICDMTAEELQQRQNKYRIWQFWEGKEMPGYLSLCHELMVAMNPTIKVDVINGACLQRLFNDTPSNFEYLIPAHKADYARCRILDRYGGMYNDFDTITLHSLQPLFDKVDVDAYHDIVRGQGGPEYNTATSGNLGPMKPSLPGVHGCSDVWHKMMAEQVSKEHGDQLIWTMNDDTLLRPLSDISRANPDSIRFYDLEPFDSKSFNGSYLWYAFHDKIQNYRLAAHVRDGKFTEDQFLVVLSNQNIPQEYKMYSREQAYCSKSKISEMIRAQLKRAGRKSVVANCSQVHISNQKLELEFEFIPTERNTQHKFANNQAAVSGSMRRQKLAGK